MLNKIKYKDTQIIKLFQILENEANDYNWKKLLNLACGTDLYNDIDN